MQHVRNIAHPRDVRIVEEHRKFDPLDRLRRHGLEALRRPWASMLVLSAGNRHVGIVLANLLKDGFRRHDPEDGSAEFFIRGIRDGVFRHGLAGAGWRLDERRAVVRNELKDLPLADPDVGKLRPRPVSLEFLGREGLGMRHDGTSTHGEKERWRRLTMRRRPTQRTH